MIELMKTNQAGLPVEIKSDDNIETGDFNNRGVSNVGPTRGLLLADDPASIVARSPENNNQTEVMKSKNLDFRKWLKQNIFVTSGDTRAIVAIMESTKVSESLDNPDEYFSTIGNNIVEFDPMDLVDPITISATITGAAIESIATTITKGLKYRKVKLRSKAFCILKTVQKHFNSLKHKKDDDKSVLSAEFVLLHDLLALEPPNECSQSIKHSITNQRIIKLLQLDEQEFCLSNIKELLNTLFYTFVGGKHSKNNHENLDELLAISNQLKGDFNIQEDHKLIKQLKSVLYKYGIKIKDDIFKTEDPEVPDSIRIKINKKKLYKKLKEANKLPSVELVKTIVAKNLEFYETLSELANYDPVKTSQHKKELIAMVLAIAGGFVPFVPVSDGIRAGVFTHRLANHQVYKKKAHDNIGEALRLLNENIDGFAERDYQLLVEYLQKSLKLKEDHLDIKIQQEIANVTIHTFSAVLSLFLLAAGPLLSLVKSIVKITSKVVATTSGAIHRNMSDNKKRADGSFITLTDLFGLIKKLYLDAVKNNEQVKQDLMQELVYLLFGIKKEIFNQIVKTEIVENSKLKLNIYHP